MSYSQGNVPFELTRLVDISAADQTLPFIAPCAMKIYGFFIVTTETWGTIDTGTVLLDQSGTVSTATPVTSGAVGTAYMGTDMNPISVAAGGTINVKTTTDSGAAGTAIAYVVADFFPESAPA